MEIPGLHSAGTAHQLRHKAGFSARSRAAVQNLLSAPRSNGHSRHHAAFTLNGESAPQEIGVPRDIHGAGNVPGEGNRSLLLPPYFFLQHLFQPRFSLQDQVRPDGDALLLFPESDNQFSFFGAVILPQLDPQPFRQAVLHGVPEIGFLFRIRENQLVLFADQVAQNAVADAFQAFHSQLRTKLNTCVRGSAFRNPVLQQQLAGAQPENVLQLDVSVFPRHHLVKHIIQADHIVQRVIDKPCCQPAVSGAQSAPAQRAVQSKRGVGIVLRNLPDHLQRSPAGFHALHRRLFPAERRPVVPDGRFVLPELRTSVCFSAHWRAASVSGPCGAVPSFGRTVPVSGLRGAVLSPGCAASVSELRGPVPSLNRSARLRLSSFPLVFFEFLAHALSSFRFIPAGKLCPRR